MWNGTGDVDVEVVALAMEHLVRPHVNDDVEIAGRAAGRAVLALAVEAQALAVGDARRESARSRGDRASTRPVPRHAAHGVRTIWPVPPHWPHVRATTRKPCW